MSARPEDVIAALAFKHGLDGWPFASDLLAALTAAGFAVVQGWQPIETAPRDGTWIWCWHEEQRWQRVGMQSKMSGPRWYYSSTGFSAQYADDAPTHWRPHPAPPLPPDTGKPT